MLAIFYMAIMAESAISLITTCVVLVIHYRSSENGAPPMPKWVRRFFLGTCARLFGIHGNYTEFDGQKSTGRSEIGEKNVACVDDFYDDFYDQHDSGNIRSNNITMSPTSESFDGTLDVILKEVQIITKNMLGQHEKSDLQEDWRLLAKVLDRIFFWIFLITVVSSALGILVPVYLINH